MAEVNLYCQPKIGILGSRGFLGSTLKKELSSADCDFIAFDRSNYPDIFNFEYLNKLLLQNSVTHLINCISFNGYEKCDSNPLVAFEVNTLYPRLLSQACELIGISLVHISTEAVFDSSAEINSVSTTPSPSTLYGKTKLCGEVVGSKAITIRLPLLTSRNANHQIVYKLLELIKQKRNIKVSNDVFTTPIIIEDFAKQLIRFIMHDSFDAGIYHASSNERLSFSKIIQLYAAFFDLNVDYIEEVSEDSFGSKVVKPRSLGLLSSHDLLTTDFEI